MHPEVRQAGAVAGLVLRDLIAVVNRYMVFATAVDIKPWFQIFGRHRRAFDMPTWETATPWAIPFHLTRAAFWAELPQGEVGRVFLFADFYALSRF